MKTMSHKMQKTPLAVLFSHVEAYRRESYLTREDFAQDVVNAHEAIGGDEVTGVVFDNVRRSSVDEDDRRRRTNANKVFRWFDDSTKNRNYLHLNLFTSILAALPIERRVACMTEMLLQVEMTAHALCANAGELNAVPLLQGLIKESAEANQAVAALVDGATKSELIKARKELTESKQATKEALMAVEAELAKHH